MEDSSEVRYVLTTPVTYAHKGNQEQATFVELTAPAARNSKECAALKQAFWKSIDTDAEGSSEAEPTNVTPEDVVTMIAMSRDSDLADALEVAKRLFTKGKVANLDGEAPLTSPVIENMAMEDLEGMFGTYMVNFILASSLRRMKEHSSKSS
jgi:hypothetical protein